MQRRRIALHDTRLSVQTATRRKECICIVIILPKAFILSTVWLKALGEMVYLGKKRWLRVINEAVSYN